MLGIITYAIVTILFFGNNICGLTSMLLPKWLVFESPRPYRTITNYGLFKKCSSLNEEGCRAFPLDEYGDCDEDFFCQEWNAASVDMILASIVGGVTLFYLIYVLFGETTQREDAWKYITGSIVLMSLLQISTISMIAHLYNKSDRFYYGVKFDVSFMLASGSAAFNFMLACIIFIVGYKSSNGNGYEPIE
ncbi:2201_t:CDS:2 [Diversispora eburnea]|uniref:2201_t:CDS:1 n=1 Tax=Diversispora eburnea TaxID=1213867 RepID=A0A9N8YRF6_9GLOM|nr:2201_t:CDS:2 [Diversispora eburnea]